MCDCCNIEERNWQFLTGEQKVRGNKLYRLFKGQTASIKLCKLCDIELFEKGESRFLFEHLGFLEEMSLNKKNYVSW